jgi:hypothetical protein
MTNEELLPRLGEGEMCDLLKELDLEVDPEGQAMAAKLEGNIAQVEVFGYDGGHNFFGLWRKDGCARNDAPVVFVDCHGGDESCTLAASLAEFLSLCLCVPTDDGASAARWVDTVNYARELPSGLNSDYMAPSLGDEEALSEAVVKDPTPEAALHRIFQHLRAKDSEAEGRAARLDAAFSPLGIRVATKPYALVEAARAKHGHFRLY